MPSALVDAVFRHEIAHGALATTDRAAVTALYSAPVVFVVVERPHAVKKLAQLCGPADPASPGACGLRSFGRSRVDNDVRLPGAASAA